MIRQRLARLLPSAMELGCRSVEAKTNGTDCFQPRQDELHRDVMCRQ